MGKKLNLTPEEKKERQRQQLKKSYLKHREKRIAECREYYKKNIKKLRERNKLAYKKSIEQRQKRKEEAYKMLIDLGLMTDCIICGFPKEKISAIEFHHTDPNNKESMVSELVCISKTQKERFINEAKKCVCLCANCHRLYHSNDTEIVKKYNEVINNGTL